MCRSTLLATISKPDMCVKDNSDTVFCVAERSACLVSLAATRATDGLPYASDSASPSDEFGSDGAGVTGGRSLFVVDDKDDDLQTAKRRSAS